mmetsp:Transcript_39321/g.113786  ORF Transcript_39321/g.113786 Transcript_39321/m.113786 type:complete len:456 (-) Transcript_39321:276-1643(-)
MHRRRDDRALRVGPHHGVAVRGPARTSTERRRWRRGTSRLGGRPRGRLGGHALDGVAESPRLHGHVKRPSISAVLRRGLDLHRGRRAGADLHRRAAAALHRHGGLHRGRRGRRADHREARLLGSTSGAQTDRGARRRHCVRAVHPVEAATGASAAETGAAFPAVEQEAPVVARSQDEARAPAVGGPRLAGLRGHRGGAYGHLHGATASTARVAAAGAAAEVGPGEGALGGAVQEAGQRLGMRQPVLLVRDDCDDLSALPGDTSPSSVDLVLAGREAPEQERATVVRRELPRQRFHDLVEPVLGRGLVARCRHREAELLPSALRGSSVPRRRLRRRGAGVAAHGGAALGLRPAAGVTVHAVGAKASLHAEEQALAGGGVILASRPAASDRAPQGAVERRVGPERLVCAPQRGAAVPSLSAAAPGPVSVAVKTVMQRRGAPPVLREAISRAVPRQRR